MEAVEAGLRSSSASIQARTVKTLLSSCHAAAKLDDTLPQYRSLWAGCRHPSFYVSELCTAGLVKLVRGGKAAFETVLDGFLDIIPGATSTHLESLVLAVFELILMHVEFSLATSKTFTSPYSVRNHPLISILTHRPDASSFMISFLDQQLSSPNLHAKELLQLILPVAEYSFLCTRGFADRYLFRGEIFLLLLKFGKILENLESIHEFLCTVLASVLLNDCESASQTLLLSRKLVESVFSAKHPPQAKIVHSIMSICSQAIEFGFSCEQALQLISTIISASQPDDDAGIVAHAAVIVAAYLLSNPMTHACRGLLRHLVPKLEQQALQLPATLVMTVLLHSVVSECPDSECQLLLQRLAVLQSSPQPASSVAVPVFAATGLALRLATALRQLAQADSPELFLDRLIYAQTLDSSADIVLLCAAALCLHSAHSAVMVRAAQYTSLLVAASPQHAMFGLSQLLYALKHARTPSTVQGCLQGLVGLCANQACTSAVVNTLVSLGKDPSLVPVALRLLLELWTRDRRVWPYLQELLLTPLRLAPAAAEEVAVSRALVMLRVSAANPDLGKDFIAALHAATVTGPSAVAAALAVDTLVLLCESALLHASDVWATLRPRLLADSRPVVLASAMDILSLLVAPIDTEPDLQTALGLVALMAENTQRKATLDLLWSFVRHPNAMVRSSALGALASFHPCALQHAVVAVEVPASDGSLHVQQMLVVRPADLAFFLEVLLERNARVLAEGWTALLARQLQTEVDGFSRSQRQAWLQGRFAVNRHSDGPHKAASDSCHAVRKFVTHTYATCAEAHVRGQLAVAMTYLPETFGDLKVGSAVKAQVRRLKDLLGESNFLCADGGVLECVAAGWHVFMHTCFEVYTQGPGQGSGDPGSEAQQSALVAAARDSIVAELRKSFQEFDICTQANVLFALTGLAACLPAHSAELEWHGLVLQTLVAVIAPSSTQHTGLLSDAHTDAEMVLAAAVLGATRQGTHMLGKGMRVDLSALIQDILGHLDGHHFASGKTLLHLSCALALRQLSAATESVVTGVLADTVLQLLLGTANQYAGGVYVVLGQCLGGCVQTLFRAQQSQALAGVWNRLSAAWTYRADCPNHDALVAALASSMGVFVAAGLAGPQDAVRLREYLTAVCGLLPSSAAHWSALVELSSSLYSLGQCTLEDVSCIVGQVLSGLAPTAASVVQQTAVTVLCASLVRGTLESDAVPSLESIWPDLRRLSLSSDSLAGCAAAAVAGMLVHRHESRGSGATVPVDLSYLGEASVLNATFQALHSSSAAKPADEHVAMLLSCYAQLDYIPPVDWAPVLKRHSIASAKCLEHCVSFSLSILLSQPSVAAFLRWTTDPIQYCKMLPEAKKLLCSRLADLFPFLDQDTASTFICTSLLADLLHADTAIRTAALSGIRGYLSTTKELAGLRSAFQRCLVSVYSSLDMALLQGGHMFARESLLLDHLAQCLSYLSATQLENMTTHGLGASALDVLRSVAMRSRLVRHSGHPTALLEHALVWALRPRQPERDEAGILHSLSLHVAASFLPPSGKPLAKVEKQARFLELLEMAKVISTSPHFSVAALERVLTDVIHCLLHPSATPVFHSHAQACSDVLADGLAQLLTEWPDVSLRIINTLVGISRQHPHPVFQAMFMRARHVPSVVEANLWWLYASASQAVA